MWEALAPALGRRPSPHLHTEPGHSRPAQGGSPTTGHPRWQNGRQLRVSPKFPCWSRTTRYFRMGLYVEVAPLKRP